MVLVVLDQEEPESSLRTIGFGAELAAGLGVALEAVAVGDGAGEVAGSVALFGAARLHVVSHDLLDDYAPEAWAQSIVQLMESVDPVAVLAPGTDRGNELLAHVGALAGLPMAANCTGVIAGEPWQVTRVRWGGSLIEEAHLDGGPRLLTVLRSGGEPAAGSAVTIEAVPFHPSLEPRHFRVRVKERVAVAAGVSLTNAPVVVGGGRGVGSADGFSILEELAGLLRGAVGCSRVVTNNGWRPHHDQVGQTGARIAPELYIACGISGAIQHWVGCMSAKTILAINIDREAPIVAKADYAVIGDLHEVVPAISAAIRRFQAERG